MSSHSPVPFITITTPIIIIIIIIIYYYFIITIIISIIISIFAIVVLSSNRAVPIPFSDWHLGLQIDKFANRFADRMLIPAPVMQHAAMRCAPRRPNRGHSAA